VSVKKFNGTDWNYIGNSGFSSSFAQSPVIAFNPLGQPDVAFVVDPYLSVMNFPSTSGISENKQISMTVFPNPCINNLNIKIDEQGFSENRFLEIFNLAGEKIVQLQVEHSNIQLDVSTYPSGIYFIKFMSNSSMWSGKFCKI
jgi:hypothetical protein